MATTLDVRQSLSRSAFGTSIGTSANATLDTILAAIDTRMATLNTAQTLTNKTIQFLRTAVVVDSTSTGSLTTLAAGDIAVGVTRLTNASLVSISGIPAGVSGQVLTVENRTGNSITVNNDEATATAANRIYTGTNSNVPMPDKSTFLFTYDAVDSRWLLTGGSGSGSGSSSGSKNYLSVYTASRSSGVANAGNGNFELGTTAGFGLGNVTLTSNFPSGVPTFGSGASGSMSISTVSSGQLAGGYSLSLSMSGIGIVAGNMLHTNAFFIDQEDQAKVMSFKFAYSAFVNSSNINFSGTSSNTFGVAIYDVTNSTWIQPAGCFNIVQGSGVGIATGTFQTSSNGTQYRLVVYAANATGGPFIMYFDDFFVGPQVTAAGAAISDPINFTPIFSASFGSVTSITANYTRYGKRAKGTVTFRTGTTTTGNATITLPSPLTADSSVLDLTNGVLVGMITADGSTTNGVQNAAYLGMKSANTLQVIQNNSVTGLTVITNTSAIYSSNSFHSFDFDIPVAGWSSNTVMSNDTDTRIIDLVANKNGGTTTLNTTIASWVTEKDTAGSFNATTGVYTVPVSGDYDVIFTFQTTTATGTPKILKNGSPVATGSGTGASSAAITTIPNCVAGDLITVQQDVSVTVSSNATGTKLIIARKSGPATIQANSIVSANYTSTSTATLTGTDTIINFDTKVYDTSAAVSTGASWKFTAPMSGLYDVYANIVTDSSTAENQTIMNIYKNGSMYVRKISVKSTTVTGFRCDADVRGQVSLLAGEFVDIRIQASVGRVLNGTATDCYVMVTRVGGTG